MRNRAFARSARQKSLFEDSFRNEPVPGWRGAQEQGQAPRQVLPWKHRATSAFAVSEVCSVNISRPCPDVLDWCVHDPKETSLHRSKP